MAEPPIITNNIEHPEYINALHEVDDAFRSYLQAAKSLENTIEISKNNLMSLMSLWNRVVEKQRNLDQIAKNIRRSS